jgi:hypothetical protein
MIASAASREKRSIIEILFSRKREVDIWPSLKGGQTIRYPARRNPGTTGSLSAMLCKACVVALKGDVVELGEREIPMGIYVRSRSQSSGAEHHCCLLESEAFLPRGAVTYHLGLLFLAEALAFPDQAVDLLDALEEILEYSRRMREPDEHYDALLMHLADEVYYWARYRERDLEIDHDRLKAFSVRSDHEAPELISSREINPSVFTDIDTLRDFRNGMPASVSTRSGGTFRDAAFRGPQLPELVESLDLGMHSLLVGPTATGKSLCALEAFDRTEDGKPVYVIEGHESLKEFDLLGGYSPDSSGSFSWNDGVLIQAMRNGGCLFVDEANRMPTRTLNVLLGVLSRGAITLTEHGSEEVKAASGFQVVMAMNLGQSYAVNSLDRALLDRFSCVLQFQYLTAVEETDLLVRETEIDRSVAQIMVKVANEARRLRRNREIAGELTPRGLFAWARKFQVKHGALLDRLQDAAGVTWLHAVAGVDTDGYLREDSSSTLLSLIEAHTST